VTRPESGARRWLQLTIGVAISATLIYFAFRGQPFGEVWHHVQSVDIVPLLAAIVLATLSFPARVPRWRILLRHDDGSEIRWPALWHPIAIGFACNNVLPLRLGEVIRVGAVSRLAPASIASSLSSLAVERIVDGLTVVGLLLLALVFADLPPDIEVLGTPVRDAALRFGIVGLVALAAGLLVATRKGLAVGMARRLTPPGPLREFAVAFTDRIVAGLAALGDPSRAARVVAWSLVLWLVNASAFWIGFAAFGIDVPFSGALLLQGVLVFAIAVPQAPGYVGGFELAIVGALALFGIDEGLALAYAVTFHVTTFVPITLLGAWSLVRTGLTIRTAREAAT
jgi:uncharacterized membrane protein YbhN (UPF0104 family)